MKMRWVSFELAKRKGFVPSWWEWEDVMMHLAPEHYDTALKIIAIV